MQTAINILKHSMSARYCGATRFDYLDQEEIVAIKKAMIEYAHQACEEQQLSCYETYDKAKGTPDEIGGAILNAPLPDLK